MLAAGADLVQVYSGFVYEGPGLVGDICRALIADAQPVAADTSDTGNAEHVD